VLVGPVRPVVLRICTGKATVLSRCSDQCCEPDQDGDVAPSTRSRGIRLLLAAEGEGLPEVASRFREAPRASHDDAKRPEPERISPQTPTPQQRDRQCPQRPLERNHPTGLCAAQHALEPPAVPGFVRDACQESPGAERAVCQAPL
jgi:hypothetical protein